MAGWKLAQLHDVDVVPCYHVNGRPNVLGRDKRVCSPTIYVVDDKFGAIDPADESRSDTFFVRRRDNPRLSLKFEDNPTIDVPDLFSKWTFSFLPASARGRVSASFVSPRTDIADDRRYIDADVLNHTRESARIISEKCSALLILQRLLKFFLGKKMQKKVSNVCIRKSLQKVFLLFLNCLEQKIKGQLITLKDGDLLDGQ